MVFDRDGNIVSLEPLNPEDVYHFKNEKGNYMYHFYKNGEYKMLSEDEIIHIPYVSIDGKIGKAPLEVAREMQVIYKQLQNLKVVSIKMVQ